MRLLLFALIAWPLPALIAGAFGWSSVWGSGSVVADYLIPIPVAGGVLHVPSFALTAAAVAMMPSLGAAAAARLRALLVGAAIAGLMLLLKLDDLWLASRTNSTFSGSVWQQNPLGLFLLGDAALALMFTAFAPQRPMLRLDALSALLLLLPIALPASMTLRFSSAGEPFLPGDSRQGQARGDQVRMVYTRLDVTSVGFHERAEKWIAPMHPRELMDNDDTAFLFTRNLDAARNFEPREALATLCVYEDGTPSEWLAGSAAAECFAGHVSFSDKYANAYAARPAREPHELRNYLARKSICAGVATIPPTGDTGGVELSGMRICTGLQKTGETLRIKYPDLAAQIDAPM